MKISIIGAGAFGLAISKMFYKNNNDIYLWSKFKEETDKLRENNKFMNIDLPKDYIYTNDLGECISNSDLIVIALPVAFINDTIMNIINVYDSQPIVIVSKGIEQETNLFAVDIVKKYIDTNDIGVLSGGTFAKDMLQDKPMGLTLATKSTKLKNVIDKTLKNNTLDIEYIDDIIGVELCGAYKNIVAIASGIIDGLSYGDSTKFYLITKCVFELRNIITLLYGNKDTINSYAGIDDMYMTCSSTNSRNFSFGNILSTKDINKINDYKNNTTIEGLYTTKSIYDLLNSKNIKSKFISVMYDILYKNKDIDLLIEYLKGN